MAIHRSSVLFAAAIGLTVALPLRAATTYDEASVLSSTPIYRVVESSIPQRECWEEEVVQHQPARHYESATPGLFGMLIGGALGNAVGHHKRNQQVGAVVGAVLGGSIARDISRSNADRRDVVHVDVQERCRTNYETVQEEKLVGYDVRYSYNGTQHTVRMPEDPGSTVRIRVDVEPVF